MRFDEAIEWVALIGLACAFVVGFFFWDNE
jgi:high-affinity Fe2+/Pb2+ permease